MYSTTVASVSVEGVVVLEQHRPVCQKCTNTTVSDGFFLLLVMHPLKQAVKTLVHDSSCRFQVNKLTQNKQQWRVMSQEKA